MTWLCLENTEVRININAIASIASEYEKNPIAVNNENGKPVVKNTTTPFFIIELLNGKSIKTHPLDFDFVCHYLESLDRWEIPENKKNIIHAFEESEVA